MNRLQTRCVIATAGCHVLLVVILFFGPMLFWHRPVQDNLPILKVIPLSAVEAAFSSGAANPTPPAPPQQQQAPPTPTPTPPEPPKQIVAPPTPLPKIQHDEPKPEEMPDEKPSDIPSPVPPPKPKHKPQEIQVNLDPVVQKSSRDDARQQAEDRAQQRAAERAAQRRRDALNKLRASLDNGLSTSTDVQMPGAGSQSYANYGQIVKSIYYNAWNLPGGNANSEATVTVHVEIARDGSVISAHITDHSGDAKVDDSVQDALDRVSFIRPFPDGAKEEKRSYNIIFDAQAKQNL